MLHVLLGVLIACSGKSDRASPLDTGSESRPDETADDSGAVADSDTHGGDTQDSGAEDSGTQDTGAEDTADSAEPDADGDGSPASEDCDDADASIHPGAEEVCEDGVDQDCDGAPGSDCRLAGSYDLYSSDIDEDYISASSAGSIAETVVLGLDFDGDGRADVATSSHLGGAWDDGWVGFLDPGPYSGRESATALAFAQISDSSHGSGHHLVGVPDADGDGYADAFVGTDSIYSFMLYGPVSGESYASEHYDEHGLARCGESTVLAGHFTGPDFDDLACFRDGEGKVRVLQGSTAGFDDEDPVAEISGLSEYNPDLGDAIAGGGDIDADGYDDLWLVRIGHEGGLVAVQGPQSGSVSSSDAATVVIEAERGVLEFGRGPLMAGDLDDDGKDDLAVGADNAVYGFYSVASSGELTDVADIVIVAEDTEIEPRPAAAGDLDCDGARDLVITDHLAGSIQNGYAWIFYAVDDGTYLLESDADVSVKGDERLGESAGAGDVDGDGCDDLVLGAKGTSDYDAPVLIVFQSTSLL